MGEQKQSELSYIDSLLLYVEKYLKNEAIDIDDYYYDLLEQALEYGMTPKEFWEEDIELFFCYRNAYYRRLHNVAHTHGLYNHIAFSTVVQNALKKQGAKAIEYPAENVFEKQLKAKEKETKSLLQNKKVITKNITKDNLEEQYRLRLLSCY